MSFYDEIKKELLKNPFTPVLDMVKKTGLTKQQIYSACSAHNTKYTELAESCLPVSPDDIIDDVLTGTEFERGDLFMNSMYRGLIAVKWKMYRRLRDEANLGPTRIARLCGECHHTAVVYAFRKGKNIPTYSSEDSQQQAQQRFMIEREKFKLANPWRYVELKKEPKSEMIIIHNPIKDLPLKTQNRLRAVSAQIKKAKQYGQTTRAEDLKNRRQLIIEGVLA
tara:strand:+ start:3252 stop:3920 length:669 start_codon:yes stop_codon:yes gene_type:complete